MGKHKAGDNLTILNTSYHYSRRDEVTNKRIPDYITLVYKDLDNGGVKEHKTIYKPKFTYYKIKDEFVTDYPQCHIEKEKVDAITTEYDKLLFDMANQLGRSDEYFQNIQNGEWKKNKLLHFDPRVMASDIGIEAFYRMEFNKMYKNDVCPVDKAYLDIEVDIHYIGNQFPENGVAPINAISLVMEKTKTEYVFLLRDSNNPNIEAFEKYTNEVDFIQEYKDFLTNALGGWKNVYRMKLQDYNYRVVFYDKEIDLISAVFRMINVVQPDFVLAWNMSFDIPYIIDRINVLGYDPVEIMCHPDFENKTVKYFVDKKHENERAERTDYADISAYSVYLDQMIQFASRRKGQSAWTQFSLDYVGGKIANVRKLDYHHIVDNLGDLPYADYKTFVMYNMMDTIVQKCIEEKTGDINYVFNKAVLNSTEYARVHRQTVYLANRAAMFYESLGYIIGNNTNKNNEKPDEKFAGAYVAPPENVSDYSKVKLKYPEMDYQAVINLAHNANDFDYTALYPSEAREHNIGSTTLIGKIEMPEMIYKGEDRTNDPKYNRSGEFIENFSSRNWIDICVRYLNLATYKEMIEDIYEYFTTVYTPSRALQDDNDKLNIVTRVVPNKINIAYREEGKTNIVRRISTYTKELKDKANNVLKEISICI